jgi:hypothetical protein
MMFMAPKLDAAGICAIIKECSAAKVAAFTLGELHISFYRPQETVVVSDGGRLEETTVPALEMKVDVLSTEPLTEDQKAVAEEFRKAQLMSDDPLAYEQEVVDSLLND